MVTSSSGLQTRGGRFWCSGEWGLGRRLGRRWEDPAAPRRGTSIGRVLTGLTLEVSMRKERRALGKGEASSAPPPSSSEVAAAAELSESESERRLVVRSRLRLGDGERPAASASESESEWKLGERSPRRLGEGARRPVPASASESRWSRGERSRLARLGDGARASASESNAATLGRALERGDLERDRDREREGEGEARRRWLLGAAPASPSEASDADPEPAAAAGRFGAMPASVGRSWFRVLDLNPFAGLLRLADMAVGLFCLLLRCRVAGGVG